MNSGVVERDTHTSLVCVQLGVCKGGVVGDEVVSLGVSLFVHLGMYVHVCCSVS